MLATSFKTERLGLVKGLARSSTYEKIVPRKRFVECRFSLGTCYRHGSCNSAVYMSDSAEETQESGFDLSAWLNPNTRGGVVVWSVLLCIIPWAFYIYLISQGADPDKAGANVGVGFVVLSCVGWAATYIFRVANKDMTYATQLKHYENAVLAKRLEELEDDEISALMEEIEIEESKHVKK